MDIGFEAAAKGAPQMAFWPTAVMIVNYPASPSPTYSAALLLVVFGGSMTYLGMRNVKSVLEDLQNKSATRRSVGRTDDSLSKMRYFRDLVEITRGYLPANDYSFVLAALLILLNIGAGGYILITLISQILTAGASNPVQVGLTALPVVYGFVIVSILIWNF